jgi:MFS transporter, MHS family, shikimate and dehydroshikimate transport protein
VTFNIYGVFLVGYLTSTLHMTRQSALSAVMVAAAIMIVMLPLCGKLSDRIGRRLLFGVASLLIGVLSFLAFYMMDGTSTLMTVIAVAIPFAFIYPAVYGPEAALFSELFDTRVRYSGISFVYQFSGIFASGLTPIIATALLPLNGGKPWYICLYILVVSAISAVSVYAMTDRHNSDIAVDETGAEGKVVRGLQPQGG